MPKLHLKRTPAEQAVHDLRKAAKAARKAKKSRRRRRESALSADHSYDSNHDEECPCRHPGPSSPPRYKRRRHKSREPAGILGSDEGLYDHHDSHPCNASAYKPDYDALRAMREEQRFREKMLNALEEDNSLQYLEERFNEWAHVPDRWRSGKNNGKGRVLDDGELDPQYMSDEDYAEWIRIGMWK